MALTLLIRYRITIATGDIPVGNGLSIYWDDVALEISTYEYDGVTFIETLRTVGPDLVYGWYTYFVPSVNHSAPTEITYQFCNGTSLVSFNKIDVFPYARKKTTVNHFSCANAVCDLTISDDYIIQKASDTITNDGSISVTATSSNSPIKYSLDPDFSYDEGQSTGVFLGLFSGTYTVTVRDLIGCVARKTLIVGIPDFYNIHYRLEYDDINHVGTRIDILERGYEGSIVEVKGGSGDPFILSYGASGNVDKFTPIIPSKATLSLLSETESYFSDLFSSDDRKYQIRYYKYDSNLSPPFVPALLPDFLTWTNTDDPNWTGVSGEDEWNWYIGKEVNVLQSFTFETTKEGWFNTIDGVTEDNTTPPDNIWNVNAALHFIYGVVNYDPFGGGGDVLRDIRLSNVSTFIPTEAYKIKIRLAINYPGTPLGSGYSLKFIIRDSSNAEISNQVITTPGAADGYFHDYVLEFNNPIEWTDADHFIIKMDGVLATILNSAIRIDTITVYTESVDDTFVRADFSNSGLTHGLNTRTDLWLTPYTFVPGESYSFAYNFTGIDSTNSGNAPIDAFYQILILDASGSIRASKLVNYVQSLGASVGTFDFICPDAAVSIAIMAFVAGGGPEVTYTIQSFTNETIPAPGDEIGFVEKWRGFIIPANYVESYIAPPYDVVVVATDGLEDLKNYDFIDTSGNKFLDDIITFNVFKESLLKTDLGLNLVLGINKFDSGMSLTEDPTKQSMFNPIIFYEDDATDSCYVALEKVIKVFGARLVQRNAKWIIYCVEESVHSFDVREFGIDGLLVSEYSFYDIVNLDYPTETDRAEFRDLTQVREILPAYGVFDFKYNLIKNESLVKSYSFELDDIITDGPITTFKNWNINIINAPGAIIGIKKTKAFDGDYNFYYKVNIGGDLRGTQITDPEIDLGLVQLVSIEQPITYSGLDLFEYKFDYSVILRYPGYKLLWNRIKWLVKVGNYYYSDVIGWTNNENYKYNSLYVESLNSPTTFKILSAFRDIPDKVTENFHVEFIIGCNLTLDVLSSPSMNELRDVPTIDLFDGARLRVLVVFTTPFPGDILAYYRLYEGTDGESGRSTIRPSDYNGTTNAKVWKLESPSVVDSTTLNTATANGGVDYVYLDNVILNLLPEGLEPPTDITTRRINTINIKENFEDEYFLNDVDDVNITNGSRIYKNYFKLLDGTPTVEWSRTYRPGTGKILDLLSGDVLTQYIRKSNRLTGRVISDRELTITTLLNEVNNGNIKYLFVGFELHDKENSVNFDMIEFKDVINDEETLEAGFTIGFTQGFRS